MAHVQAAELKEAQLLRFLTILPRLQSARFRFFALADVFGDVLDRNCQHCSDVLSP